MTQLVEASGEWRAAFLSMAREWRASGSDRYRAALDDFEGYLARVRRFEQPSELPAGWVPGTEYWLEDAGQIVGGVRLRFWLNAELEREGGHVGYDVRPLARGRGLGTAALRLLLPEARRHRLERLRVTVDADNLASVRVIEKNGGVLSGEATSEKSGKRIKQYWIVTPQASE